MTLPVQLRKMMPHMVTVERKLGENAYVEPIFGTPRRVAAQITGKIQQVVTNTGEEATSMLTIILAEAIGVGADDRITLPDPYTPTQPRILSISRFPSEKKDGFFEVVYA